MLTVKYRKLTRAFCHRLVSVSTIGHQLRVLNENGFLLGDGFEFLLGFGIVLREVENVLRDGKVYVLVFVRAFDLGEFLQALVLRVLEDTALINILHVLGRDPRRRRDFTEGFDSGVFFAETSELFNEPSRSLNINARFFRNDLDISAEISLTPDGEKTQIFER